MLRVLQEAQLQDAITEYASSLQSITEALEARPGEAELLEVHWKAQLQHHSRRMLEHSDHLSTAGQLPACLPASLALCCPAAPTNPDVVSCS